MDLIMDTFYQKYKNCIEMATLIMSILFPCVIFLLLHLSFFPSIILILPIIALPCLFIGLILTLQKRE